jgi:hypothetical protein
MQSIIPTKRKQKRQLQKPLLHNGPEPDSHSLHWALCDFYLESVHLPPLFCLQTRSTQSAPTTNQNIVETQNNVQFAISTLQDLLTKNIKPKIELTTRLALAKLVIQYTEDWELADEHLRTVVSTYISRIAFQSILMFGLVSQDGQR